MINDSNGHIWYLMWCRHMFTMYFCLVMKHCEQVLGGATRPALSQGGSKSHKCWRTKHLVVGHHGTWFSQKVPFLKLTTMHDDAWVFWIILNPSVGFVKTCSTPCGRLCHHLNFTQGSTSHTASLAEHYQGLGSDAWDINTELGSLYKTQSGHHSHLHFCWCYKAINIALHNLRCSVFYLFDSVSMRFDSAQRSKLVGGCSATSGIMTQHEGASAT